MSPLVAAEMQNIETTKHSCSVSQ